MYILFLSRRFYPQIGGVEKHVLELSKQLIQKGYTVTVITESPTNVAQKASIGGINVYRLPVGREGKKKKFQIWSALWKSRKLIREADIIHCHDVFFWYLPFRFLYPCKPVYTTFHGYESYPVKRKAIWIRKLSEKLSWGNICIGDFIKKWYGTRADYISYGAVEDVEIKNQELRIKESAIFIGRLDEQTGILEYVKAVELIKKQFPKFDLLAVGDGKYKKAIEKQVKVIGFQKDPEKYFANYQFAFVSRYLSILEAFAAKKLVFALYDNPVKEDYLRMTPFAPWIIIVGTPKELAERAVYYLQHPEEEKKLIEKSYAWVKEQSWEKMAEIYLELWEKGRMLYN